MLTDSMLNRVKMMDSGVVNKQVWGKNKNPTRNGNPLIKGPWVRVLITPKSPRADFAPMEAKLLSEAYRRSTEHSVMDGGWLREWTPGRESAGSPISGAASLTLTNKVFCRERSNPGRLPAAVMQVHIATSHMIVG